MLTQLGKVAALKQRVSGYTQILLQLNFMKK